MDAPSYIAEQLARVKRDEMARVATEAGLARIARGCRRPGSGGRRSGRREFFGAGLLGFWKARRGRLGHG